MQVLLTHGYFLEEDEKEKAIMKPYPPLGILYLSAYLNQHHIENELFDSTFSNKEKFKAHCLKVRPKVLAIYANLVTKINVVKIFDFFKTNLPDTTIIVGGPDVTYNIENYLNAGADYAIFGEGEQTLHETVEFILHQKGDRKEIQGLAYFEGETLQKNPPRIKIKNIDELPIPNREGIDLSLYLNTWKKYHGKNAISVSTQRGCPYTCKWCSTAVYGQSYRRRSPENVVKELLFLKEKYNPDSIWFVDDVFTVSHKWLKAFSEEVVKQNAVIPFECITRAERMNDEVIALLKAAGCFRIWIGAESGSQKIIDKMDRRVDVNRVRDMLVKTREAGIETGTFIMLGYPDETEEDIRETIKHLKIANPTYFTITKSYPIRGTDLFDEIQSDITNPLMDWNTTTDRQIEFKTTYPKRYYDYAIRKVVNEVHYNKSMLTRSPRSLLFKSKSLFASVMMKIHRS